MDLRNTILLTGAGFTANFGGFLAKEMWAKIFNNPKLNDAVELKKELRENFDFEELYSMLIEKNVKNFEQSDLDALENSIDEAYLSMDEIIKSPSLENIDKVHRADLRKFLDFFSQERKDKIGACFTLNQDLFMERVFGWQPLGPKSMKYEGTVGNLNEDDLNSEKSKVLPTQKDLESYKKSSAEKFYYVKLHGSLKWVREDGTDTKVLGINKKELINKIPLLKWYFEIFEQFLFRKNIKLVVIGYSFNDPHVNAIIVKAIREHELKLYVVTTEDPSKFSGRMRYKHPQGRGLLNEQDEEGTLIWNAVEGYFSHEMRKVFPIPQQGITSEREEIFKSIGVPLLK